MLFTFSYFALNKQILFMSCFCVIYCPVLQNRNYVNAYTNLDKSEEEFWRQAQGV